MEPIINPWLVYLIGIVDTFRASMAITFLLLFLATMARLTIAIEERKLVKPCVLVAVILALVLGVDVLIPSSKTIIAIYVAGQVTEDRIKAAGPYSQELREGVKSDIIDIIHGDDQ